MGKYLGRHYISFKLNVVFVRRQDNCLASGESLNMFLDESQTLFENIIVLFGTTM